MEYQNELIDSALPFSRGPLWFSRLSGMILIGLGLFAFIAAFGWSMLRNK